MEKQLQNEDMEIDLRELLFVLKRKIWVIVSAFIAGLVVMAVYTIFFVTPLYSATSVLYILPTSTSITSLSDLQLGAQLTSDYVILIKSRPVLEDTIENLGLNMSAGELGGMISTSNPSGSRVLKITVTHPVPQTAQNLANELANVTCKRMAEIMATEEPNIVEDAVLPGAPVSPNLTKNCAMGALACTVIAIALITVLYLFDDTIKSAEDVEKYLQMSVLGVIPEKEGALKHKYSRHGSGKAGHHDKN